MKRRFVCNINKLRKICSRISVGRASNLHCCSSICADVTDSELVGNDLGHVVYASRCLRPKQVKNRDVLRQCQNVQTQRQRAAKHQNTTGERSPSETTSSVNQRTLSPSSISSTDLEHEEQSDSKRQRLCSLSKRKYGTTKYDSTSSRIKLIST